MDLLKSVRQVCVRPSLLPERSPVLLRALSVRLAMTLTIEELTGLLSGEVLASLHGLALLSLLRIAAMLLAVMLLAVVLPASMLTSVSHYNITQDKSSLVSKVGKDHISSLSERPSVLLRALSVGLAMSLTIEELTGLLSGEVLASLHGLALLSLLRVATMLPASVLPLAS